MMMIDDAARCSETSAFEFANWAFLDSFQSSPAVFQSGSWFSLELLENAIFPFASPSGPQYRLLSTFKERLRFHDCLFL
jgi:hypothetical protein